MNLKSLINEILAAKMADSPIFLVKLLFKEDKKSIEIFLDGDIGVSIEDCTAVSRDLRFHLTEAGVELDLYDITVSSPGIEQSLVIPRQFPKNMGRTFDITTKQNEKMSGILVSCNETELNLEITEGKGKLKTVTEKSIPFSEINEAKIVLSFK